MLWHILSKLIQFCCKIWPPLNLTRRWLKTKNMCQPLPKEVKKVGCCVFYCRSTFGCYVTAKMVWFWVFGGVVTGISKRWVSRLLCIKTQEFQYRFRMHPQLFFHTQQSTDQPFWYLNFFRKTAKTGFWWVKGHLFVCLIVHIWPISMSQGDLEILTPLRPPSKHVSKSTRWLKKAIFWVLGGLDPI